MSSEWLDDAVKGATGNVTLYKEFETECFSLFQKYRENGYPDMIIVALMCDITKMVATIPMMFDKWRSQND